MKIIVFLLATLLLISTNNCCAGFNNYIPDASLNMEDDSNLTRLPTEVFEAIKPSYLKFINSTPNCLKADFLGIQVDLHGDGVKADWIAMTNSVCALDFIPLICG